MKKNAKKALIVLSVACIFLFQLIPPPSGLTALSMQIAGIFLGTIVLWLTTSVTWPSLLCIFALILTPLYSYSSAISSSFGNWVTGFIMFSQCLCYILQKTGFLRRCAIWFITRPITKRNPWIFLGLLFLAPIVIGSFMSPMTAFIIFVPIIDAIFMELGYQKGDPFPKIVSLAVLCCASISSLTTPIAHTMPIMGMSLYTTFSGGDTIGFVPYTIAGSISVLLILILVLLTIRFLYRPDLSRLYNINTDFLLKDQKPMQREEKISVAVFLAVVLLWMLPGLIENIFPTAYKVLNGLGTPTPPLIGLILLAVLKVDGKPIADLGEVFSKGVSWATTLLVAGTIILGEAITNTEVGLTDWIGSFIAPMVQSIPTSVSVLLITLLAVVITNFCSSTVTVTIVASIILPLTISGAIPDINSAAIAVIIGMGACVAMATPPATAHAAIAAGTGWLDLGTMFRWGMLMSLISALVLAFVCYPLLSFFL